MIIADSQKYFEDLLQFHADALKEFQEKYNRELKLDYSSIYDFVNTEGTFYIAWRASSRFNWKVLVKDWKPKEQECFKNAWGLVTHSHIHLDYCEGYAMHPRLIPLPHAWCVDKNGRVYDPTWDLIDDNLSNECALYKGVKFKIRYVTDVFSKNNECGSIIDNWKQRWPLLANNCADIREQEMVDKPIRRPQE